MRVLQVKINESTQFDNLFLKKKKESFIIKS